MCGYLHPCAEQVPLSQPRRAGHPRWCAQGQGGCAEPRRYPDGTTEWDHTKRVDVRGEHGAGDVFLVRIDAVRDREHDVCKALVLTADGTFTADEAEGFALQILAAVRQLDGTPGGLPAVLAALPEPWQPVPTDTTTHREDEA